jgi:hypothetical protein
MNPLWVIPFILSKHIFMKLFTLLFFLISPLFNTEMKNVNSHAFHISRTTLNYDTPTKTYQLTIHIFIDDLTKCLEKKGYKNLNIGSKSESKLTDEAVEKYIKEKMVLSDGKPIAIDYVGREFSEDGIALYCYFETKAVVYSKNLTVTNALLLELFEDQKNIVDVTKDKKRVGQLLCQSGSESQKL